MEVCGEGTALRNWLICIWGVMVRLKGRWRRGGLDRVKASDRVCPMLAQVRPVPYGTRDRVEAAGGEQKGLHILRVVFDRRSTNLDATC